MKLYSDNALKKIRITTTNKNTFEIDVFCILLGTIPLTPTYANKMNVFECLC